ncbi:hypothetical protein ACMFMG_011353 [Clarireedia jacksonii]
MAERNGHTDGGSAQDVSNVALPLLVKDFKDDTKPDHLLNDPVALYLRARYGQREAFFNEQNEDSRMKIDHERKRIAGLRGRFALNDNNKKMLEKLQNLRKEWKKSAREKCADNKTYVENEFEKTLKDIEPDIKSGEVRRRKENKLQILEKVANWNTTIDTGETNDNNGNVTDESGYGFKMAKITLERGSSQGSPFKKYKLEKFSIDEAIGPKPKRNPWAENRESNTDTIRYFHFPANNTEWVEEAIKRYEEHEKIEDARISKKLLSRELWSGQQHGTLDDPIHARHMRSHCTVVPSDTPQTNSQNESGSKVDKANKHMVIFMPYLHWEVDRKREKIATLAKELTDSYKKTLPMNHNIRNKNILADTLKLYKNKLKVLHMSEAENRERVAEEGRPKELIPHTLCGKLLLQAAHVYEAMDLEPDVELLHNLHTQRPVHPRRTLDQSYYSKLEHTEARDVDQVVYRGTKARREINRNTRVIMVDQLWLYILDGRTIITSFPRRMGRNKPDSSGVHKCIRNRLEKLQDAEDGRIYSVYDLALIIMNECSTVFFDRTKPIDERPEVLDIFSGAIGYVSEMKTIAFEGFWRHLGKLNGSGAKIDPEMERIYLNINPEGELLREAHDIIEELRMMARIFTEQLQVAGRFSKSLEKINGQTEPMQESIHVLHAILHELEKANCKTENGHADISLAVDTKAIPSDTIHHSFDFVERVSSRRKEIEQLEESARDIAEQLRDLLSLKQQQASIIEAIAALSYADESVQQGRSIMVFTTITIIFLPLSFMSSLFGMNAKELAGPDGGIMSIGEQFKYMLAFLGLIKPPNANYFLTFVVKAFWFGFKKKHGKEWEAILEKSDEKRPRGGKLSEKQRKKLSIIYTKSLHLRKKLTKQKPDQADASPIPGIQSTPYTKTPAGSTIHIEQTESKRSRIAWSNGGDEIV